ncbi:MAG TPA: DapH/DapD/GlmU-related protein [Cytophagaceae bacterium]
MTNITRNYQYKALYYLGRKLVNIFFRILNSDLYISLRGYFFYLKSEEVKKKFLNYGEGFSTLPSPCILKNPRYISIGKNFSALGNLRLEAWDSYGTQRFSPRLIIGDNVCFNTDIHIGCIDLVKIGNNVLLASRIFISDHSHGEISQEALALPPVKRPLCSKGPVIIEDNVWVGEGVSILAGVTIGRNSIIGANAVVTKSIPENSVAIGVPAKVINKK